MNLSDALKARRSIRRFKQDKIEDAALSQLLEAAVSAPSAGNGQPLRYAVVRTPEHVKSLFDLTAWAAHVRPKRTPVWGVSSPVAFIAVCVASGVEQMPLVYSDAGAAIENILLKALDLGLGGCWLGAFDKNKAADAIGLDKDLVCLYLIALGVPDEKPVMEMVDESASLKYSVDDSDVLHVPKRAPRCVAVWF